MREHFVTEESLSNIPSTFSKLKSNDNSPFKVYINYYEIFFNYHLSLFFNQKENYKKI